MTNDEIIEKRAKELREREKGSVYNRPPVRTYNQSGTGQATPVPGNLLINTKEVQCSNCLQVIKVPEGTKEWVCDVCGYHNVINSWRQRR